MNSNLPRMDSFGYFNNISENNEMKNGWHVYKLKKHHNIFYNYLELNDNTIIFHDVILDDSILDSNKSNLLLKRVYRVSK